MALLAAQPPHGGVVTERIPPETWNQFLHQFTEFNAEVLVRIEALGSPETGTGILADHLPLLDVTLDDEGGVPLILIECGDPAALHGAGSSPEAVRHIIREPTALWARKTEPAGWDALQIQNQDGSIILSLDPHPECRSAQEDAGKELLHSGSGPRTGP